MRKAGIAEGRDEGQTDAVWREEVREVRRDAVQVQEGGEVMTGPFTTSRTAENGCAVHNGDGDIVFFVGSLGDPEPVTAALAGVLNSAPAGQPLEVTLANLAAGRAA